MSEKEDNKYYVGLDLGTSSVGWAVTDTEYRLKRAKGKTLWGARLFEEAEKAEERRFIVRRGEDCTERMRG